jgi:hypothetical protein
VTVVVRSKEGKNVSKNGYLRTFSAAIAFAASVTMLACGGDLAPGPEPVNPAGAATTVSGLEVSASKTLIESKADQTSIITVTAVDANRRALPDIPISLSATSGVLSGQADKTDAQGRITATFGIGADKANRDVTITATSGTVTGAVGVSVTGTTLTLSASPPTAVNASTAVEIIASVADAAKLPLGGVVVNFVTSGGTLSASFASTDATGLAKTTLTGVTADVTVNSVGANAAASVAVKSGSTAVPPPEPAGVLIKDLTIQVNPSVIAPNTGGAESSFAQLDVRVTGDLPPGVGIPVVNAPVRFRIASTPAFGKLSVDTTVAPVLTSTSGSATARFIPGGATTGADQIVICASVDNVAMLPNGGAAPCLANEKAVKLAISNQPLFVLISTNDKIEEADQELNYLKPFSIYVTDAAGKGVSGATVSVRLLPRFYYKGRTDPAGPPHFPIAPYTQCPNEDLNFNGVLDTGDNNQNNDDKLWPGQAAAFTLENAGVTDSTGFVILKVKYGQRYAFWAEYQIEARAVTAGSERTNSYNFL